MLIPRWRKFSMLKDSLIASSSTTSAINLAYFHSTPLTCEKRKIKWNSDGRKPQAQQPSQKNQIKFATRQKRADTKRALKDLLFHSGSSHASVQGEESLWKFGVDSEKTGKKGRSKFHRDAKKSRQKKIKRKTWKDSLSDDEYDPEAFYHAAYGNRSSTWSFGSFQSSTFEFQWRDQSNRWKNRRCREWDTGSESESNDDSCTVGSSSDRIVLGLPPTGPLKIEDVKNAYRSSALKWHPDMHQGPSQAMAEEKFKLCVTAYKSLCNAFA